MQTYNFYPIHKKVYLCCKIWDYNVLSQYDYNHRIAYGADNTLNSHDCICIHAVILVEKKGE